MLRTMRKTLILLLSLAALALPAAGTEPKDELYRAAQRDLDSGHWNQAIEKFGQLAQKGGSAADAALYWKAYAENKAGRSQQALTSLRQLASAHPKSEWRDDAKALEVEIRGDAGDDGALSESEELKLYALNGLLGTDPDRALPMLQKFLQGNHSPRLKEQALFVISQNESPEARKVLLDVARGSAHPELQLKAVEYLGIAGGDDNVKQLDELYRSSNRPEVKRSILNAYLIAEQPDKLLAVARDAKDPGRGLAIDLLGGMDAQKELRQLYRSESSPDLRRRVLQSLGVAGDVETLAEVARQEQDASLRRQAIQGLGIADSEKAAEVLRSLYAASSDLPTRKAVLEALFIRENARALIDLYRNEKDREVRREIVRYLSMMDSDEATQFLSKIFEG